MHSRIIIVEHVPVVLIKILDFHVNMRPVIFTSMLDYLEIQALLIRGRSQKERYRRDARGQRDTCQGIDYNVHNPHM